MNNSRLCLFGLLLSASITSAQTRLAPYSDDKDHLWNQLHAAMFVRDTHDGRRLTHSSDPLLYRGGTFLLEGEAHGRAVALLDRFINENGAGLIENPTRRLMLMRDLWAAFDYCAWYADDWVFKSKHEPAAIALRTRLAKAIAQLRVEDVGGLDDNYAAAVKSKQFASEHDAKNPRTPFLPADLFDNTGPWVRFHEATARPMTERHFEGAGGRSAHVVFIHLPGGRGATEAYLKSLERDAVAQFPAGTMVAMVRRPLAIDRTNKLRATPITEMVQIRVYRRIPANPAANMAGDFGEQDAYEFVLDRAKLFSGEHGLRAVGAEELPEPFVRNEGDPFVARRDGKFEDPSAIHGGVTTTLKTCLMCHQRPGVYSVMSMQRGLGVDSRIYSETFRTYDFNVELKYTMRAKTERFEWGLLQGMMEKER